MIRKPADEDRLLSAEPPSPFSAERNCPTRCSDQSQCKPETQPVGEEPHRGPTIRRVNDRRKFDRERFCIQPQSSGLTHVRCMSQTIALPRWTPAQDRLCPPNPSTSVSA